MDRIEKREREGVDRIERGREKKRVDTIERKRGSGKEWIPSHSRLK